MHYIWGLMHHRVISLQYFPSIEQTTDIFTKSFTENTFTWFISFLGVSDGKWWLSFTYRFSSPCPFLRVGFVPMRFSSFPHFSWTNKFMYVMRWLEPLFPRHPIIFWLFVLSIIKGVFYNSNPSLVPWFITLVNFICFLALNFYGLDIGNLV